MYGQKTVVAALRLAALFVDGIAAIVFPFFRKDSCLQNVVKRHHNSVFERRGRLLRVLGESRRVLGTSLAEVSSVLPRALETQSSIARGAVRLLAEAFDIQSTSSRFQSSD